jgi:hypothetical protein
LPCSCRGGGLQFTHGLLAEIVSRCVRELKVKVPRVELRKLTSSNGLIDLLHRVLPTDSPTAPATVVVEVPVVGAEFRPARETLRSVLQWLKASGRIP